MWRIRPRWSPGLNWHFGAETDLLNLQYGGVTSWLVYFSKTSLIRSLSSTALFSHFQTSKTALCMALIRFIYSQSPMFVARSDTFVSLYIFISVSQTIVKRNECMHKCENWQLESYAPIAAEFLVSHVMIR